MNADHPVRPGQRIGKYILGEPIAREEMAEVWSARVEGPEGFVKSFALKFVLESFRGDSELERLFVNEARVAAQLQHANLVTVFDFDKIADPDGGVGGRFYIAMERVDGFDLRRVEQDVLRRGQRLPPSVMLHIAGEVLKGLRHVHERRHPDTMRSLGLVHRDVSPHNILIGMGGEVKLSDFGIAKAMAQSFGTQSGMIRGKLAYASPEQLRNEPLDHRTDQFALGVTLWEGLAGRRLFDGTDAREIIAKVNDAVVPPLPAEAGVDAAVEAVVRRMLAAHAKARFPSTAEALSAVLAAPGYTADAAPLAALMGELFATPAREVPATLRLPGSQERDNVQVGLAATGLAETKTLDRGPQGQPVGAAVASARVQAHSQRVTANDRAPRRDSAGRASEKSGRHSGKRRASGGAREGLVDGAGGRPRDPMAVTGSSYVSGAFPEDALRIARVRPPAGAMIVIGTVAVVLIGAIGLVAWRGAHRDEPAAASLSPSLARPAADAPAIEREPFQARHPPAAAAPVRPGSAEPDAGVVGEAAADEIARGAPPSEGSGADLRLDDARHRHPGRRDGRREPVLRPLDEQPPPLPPLSPAPAARVEPVAAPEKPNALTPAGSGVAPNGAPVLQ